MTDKTHFADDATLAYMAQLESQLAAANARLAGVVEECANVVRRKYDEFSKRSYPPPSLLLKLEEEIRALAPQSERQADGVVVPEPVAWKADDGRIVSDYTKKNSLASSVIPSFHIPLYGPDLLDCYLRMKAERDEALEEAASFRGSFHSAERQLSELQAKHDALVKRMREPSNDMLSAMVYSWEHSFGTPFSRYKTMLNAAIDIAMSAVALRREGEK